MLKLNIFSIISAPYSRFTNKVTSQDLLKALALFVMIIDHIGLYIFPDDLWFRAIGRITLPVWFFFVGYNFKPYKTLLNQLLFLAIALQLGMYLLGQNIFPLNALFSMVICRIAVHYYSQIILKKGSISLFEWFILSFLSVLFYDFSSFYFQYGSLAILMAIWGYNIRLKDNNGLIQSSTITALISFTQVLSFAFNLEEIIFCVTLMTLIVYILYKYQLYSLNIQGVAKYIINISSRYTLYLYCAHLLLLIAIA